MTRKQRRAKSEDSVPRYKKEVEIRAKTPTQKDYIKAIQANDITFGIGSAGTGKTYIAAKMAMKSFVAGRVSKIVICRPAVTAGGEQLGFLPGGINEKMDPFIQPIFDAFREYWSAHTIQDHLKNCNIEIIPLAYMRGRSLSDTFIIADEMQNATTENMLMLLTRLGEGSKMVITGDPIQSDINGHSSFHTAEGILHRVDTVGFVKFLNSDVVRHPTVAKILNVWPDNGIVVPERSFGEHQPAFIDGDTS